ncbi:RloB family protein [Devosia sp. XGJD_8]|uniref:RloB family protein n=1 Tax=Devosia sp. XGJD_8 TaxID=3391187 RepID=UPI0039850947
MPKNRSRSSQDLKRSKPRRTARERILIVCEGSKTEPNYLEEIRQESRISSVDVRVLHSVLGTEPKQVVESAEAEFKRTKGYERVYAVFDRDDHLTYDTALDMAVARNEKWKNDEGVATKFEAIATVQSFELWLLLHFEDIKAFLHRTETLARLKTHIAGYEKGNKGSYAKTVANIQTAIDRATALKAKFDRPPSDDAYTDMHELVSLLRGLKAK